MDLCGFGALSSLTRDRPPTAIELGGTNSSRSFGFGNSGFFDTMSFLSSGTVTPLVLNFGIKPRLFLLAFMSELALFMVSLEVFVPLTSAVITFACDFSGFVFVIRIDFRPRIDFSCRLGPISSFILLRSEGSLNNTVAIVSSPPVSPSSCRCFVGLLLQRTLIALGECSGVLRRKNPLEEDGSVIPDNTISTPFSSLLELVVLFE